MAINISASNLTLRSVALKVLDERAPHALTASGGHCSGDLHILVVYLNSCCRHSPTMQLSKSRAQQPASKGFGRVFRPKKRGDSRRLTSHTIQVCMPHRVNPHIACDHLIDFIVREHTSCRSFSMSPSVEGLYTYVTRPEGE
jgi:hypothetical protein